MRKHAALLLVLFGLGCQSSGEGSQSGSGGTGAPMVGGWGGPVTGSGGSGSGAGTGGMGPTAGGSAGGSPGATLDASAGGTGSTVDTGECPFSMAGKTCAPSGAGCAWNNDCVARRCDCLNGTWTCTERQMPCGGMCPAPQNARCGDACTGSASGCLCHSGGGPNYAGCSCTGGRWQCGR